MNIPFYSPQKLFRLVIKWKLAWGIANKTKRVWSDYIVAYRNIQKTSSWLQEVCTGTIIWISLRKTICHAKTSFHHSQRGRFNYSLLLGIRDSALILTKSTLGGYNLKESTLNLPIAKILKLQPTDKTEFYFPFHDFPTLEALSGLDNKFQPSQTKEKMKMIEYVKDFTHDGRTRTLSIITYENNPFAVFQYIGKGNVENFHIFDQTTYEKLLGDFVTEHVKHLSKEDESITLDARITIKNYDDGYFSIENNQIVSKSISRFYQDDVFFNQQGEKGVVINFDYTK